MSVTETLHYGQGSLSLWNAQDPGIHETTELAC